MSPEAPSPNDPSPMPPLAPAHQGPARMVRMNCEASRLLTRSAIEADRVIRRGLNRVGRGRLDALRFQVGDRQLKDKIRELDRTIQEVLLLFVPSEAQGR